MLAEISRADIELSTEHKGTIRPPPHAIFRKSAPRRPFPHVSPSSHLRQPASLPHVSPHCPARWPTDAIGVPKQRPPLPQLMPKANIRADFGKIFCSPSVFPPKSKHVRNLPKVRTSAGTNGIHTRNAAHGLVRTSGTFCQEVRTSGTFRTLNPFIPHATRHPHPFGADFRNTPRVIIHLPAT